MIIADDCSDKALCYMYSWDGYVGQSSPQRYLPGYEDVLRLQCDLDPQCNAFALMNPVLITFRNAARSATAYFSQTSCGDPSVYGGPPDVVTRSDGCDEPGTVCQHMYAYCPCYGYKKLQTVSGSPTQVKKLCDANIGCSLFEVKNDGSE